jgi:hypothetical protein
MMYSPSSTHNVAENHEYPQFVHVTHLLRPLMYVLGMQSVVLQARRDEQNSRRQHLSMGQLMRLT